MKTASVYPKLYVYMLLALLLRAAALSPLVCLVAFESGAWQQWLALLCPALLVLVVLPLRFSFAESLIARRTFSIGGSFSFSDYGEKLKQAVLHALSVLKWGIPLAAMLGYAAYWMYDVDALTLLETVTDIGRGWTEGFCAAANAVGGLFGAQPLVPSANTLMDGVLVLCGVLALGVLLWLYGAARNSATRYIWVLANEQDRSPRTEVRRRLMGRRLRQLGVALVNLLLCVPFWVVIALVAKSALSDLSTTLMMAMAGAAPKADLSGLVLPLAAAFVGLYLTVLPIRRCLTAAFAVRERRVGARRETAA